MAQGAPKKLSTKPTARPQGQLRKGSRVIKPKTKKATRSVTSNKLKKKLSAGIAAKTEELLGERAGHLELIGKGKKSKKEEKHKGGSKKFG